MEPVQKPLLWVCYLHLRATRLSGALDPFVQERAADELLKMTAELFKVAVESQLQNTDERSKDAETTPFNRVVHSTEAAEEGIELLVKN